MKQQREGEDPTFKDPKEVTKRMDEMSKLIKQMNREIHGAKQHKSHQTTRRRASKPINPADHSEDTESHNKPPEGFKDDLQIHKTTASVKVEGNRLIVVCDQTPAITEGAYRVKIMRRRGRVKVHLAKTPNSRILKPGGDA